MKNTKFFWFELSGAVLCLGLYAVLLNLYELTGRSTISIVLGAVNGSVWERLKCLIIPYMAFGLLELLCLRAPFKAIVSAKAAGLLGLIILGFLLGNIRNDYIYGAAVTAAGFAASYLLSGSRFELKQLFALSVFFAALVFVCVISFTAFPPQFLPFRDPQSGLYGVIPTDFDLGAVVLGL